MVVDPKYAGKKFNHEIRLGRNTLCMHVMEPAQLPHFALYFAVHSQLERLLFQSS